MQVHHDIGTNLAHCNYFGGVNPPHAHYVNSLFPGDHVIVMYARFMTPAVDFLTVNPEAPATLYRLRTR